MKKNLSLFFAIISVTLLLNFFFFFILKKSNLSADIPNFRFIELREYGVNQKKVHSAVSVNALPPFQLSAKEYDLHTDENGFIVTAKNHLEPEIKLVFLGGSTTECLYVNELNRYPEFVARLVEARTGKKVNSYNCGMSGNNSLHSINILINKVLPLKPDIAFFNHNINDLITLYYLHSYWSTGEERSPVKSLDFVKSKYNNRSMVDDMVSLVAGKKGGDSPKGEFQNIGNYVPMNDSLLFLYSQSFRNNVRTFISVCKSNAIQPVLLSQPNHFSRLDLKWFKKNRRAEMDKFINSVEIIRYVAKGTTLFNEIVKEEAASQKCLFIDLYAAINNPADFYDEVHMNDSGAIHASSIIVQKLFDSGNFHQSK